MAKRFALIGFRQRSWSELLAIQLKLSGVDEGYVGGRNGKTSYLVPSTVFSGDPTAGECDT